MSVATPAAASTRGQRAPAATPTVSAVVLTYEPEAAMLRRCLDSLVASSHRPLELVLVDNGSRGRAAAAAAAGWSPGPTDPDDLAAGELAARDGVPVRFVPLAANLGFAEGTNRGIEAATGELCLLLNPDTEIEPDTISHLVAAARRHREAIGFAPKILFVHDRQLIDSIGLVFHDNGGAAQRGLGSYDVGQYDREEPVSGVCFGAALVRREAFTTDRVGWLDRRYFMFYEDVDWSLRAFQRGESFWTVPEARVYHVHSASTRHRPDGYKYHLIQRNLLLTVFKNFERQRVRPVLMRRAAFLLRNAARGQHRSASLRALAGAGVGFCREWGARREQQQRRRRSDAEIFQYNLGERTHFDAAVYRPVHTWETLRDMVRRLYVTTAEPRWERAHAYVEVAGGTAARHDPQLLRSRLEAIAAPLPAGLVRFLDEMGGPPAASVPGTGRRSGG
ncbi:MAG TPA: glycosyltransferase family 2 protein [Candidatus Micrarchaeia archaeon]|nr:glycosyltransferase family 2 protein [Candidatus Micrarchaeia archaeon]